MHAHTRWRARATPSNPGPKRGCIRCLTYTRGHTIIWATEPTNKPRLTDADGTRSGHKRPCPLRQTKAVHVHCAPIPWFPFPMKSSCVPSFCSLSVTRVREHVVLSACLSRLLHGVKALQLASCRFYVTAHAALSHLGAPTQESPRRARTCIAHTGTAGPGQAWCELTIQR